MPDQQEDLISLRLTDPLNERQLIILRWIADGHPDGQVAGTSYKHTARALQDRRLVKIDRRGGGWAAALTDHGRHYLEHGQHPLDAANEVPPCRRPQMRTAATAQPQTLGSAVLSEATEDVDLVVQLIPLPTSTALPTPRAPRLSPTEQLVADVVAAGGRLELQPEPDRRYGWHDRITELIRNANCFDKAPAGKRLRLDRIRDADRSYHDRYVAVLEDGPAGTDAELQPVPVPDEVHRYHPAVSQLRKTTELPTSPANRRRWCILHGLAVEAERRGFTVKAHRAQPVADHRSRTHQWDLLLGRDGEIVPLRLSEESDRVEHVPTARELAEQKRSSWFRMPTHDTVPSGRLRVDIGGLYGSERRSSWADRTRWTLEDKLSEVLREVAVRLDELRMKREAQADAEASYREAVEQERRRARERAGESHRSETLDQQLRAWRQAAELRAYAVDLAARIVAAESADEVDADATAEARRWLAWIEERARTQDPLTELPAWPAAPDLPSWDLEKFMRHVPQSLEMSYRPATY